MSEPFKPWTTPTVNVKFTNATDEEKQIIKDYAFAKYNDLPISVDLVEGITSYTGGINISFLRGIPECYGTRWVGGFNTDNQPIQIQSIKIDRNCLERIPADSNYYNGFRNIVTHELYHGLCGAKHLYYIKPMLNPLMSTGLNTANLEWTWNDEWNLLEIYGTNRGKYRTFKFNPDKVGQICYLIHKTTMRFSVSFEVTSTKMRFKYLKPGGYKKHFLLKSTEEDDD